MSNFYRSNLNEGNEISMATSSFFTDRVFESREEMMQWVQNATFSLGYIIVTRRSKAKENGLVSYVTLICDRGGEYKFKESSKKSGTKKTNCKFRLNVTLRDILSTLNEQHENNVSTLKTIYNARQKLHSSPNVGKTPIQIVGTTSTNKTFSIAFAFIINEKEENYNWALSCLKLTLEECMYPRVIVMDRELALMNACQQVFPDATRLLCKWHITENIKKHCECIPLDSIDVFWRKLNLSPSTFVENEDICYDGELEMFKENFTKQSKAGKKSLLRKLRDIFQPSKTLIKEPTIQKNTRGLPTLKKQQQKQVNSISQAPRRRSHSTTSKSIGLDLVELNKDPARHSSYVTKIPDLNQEPSEQVSDFIDLNQIPESCDTHSLMKKISDMFHPYITHVQDVRGDGNCGFRAISICLGYGEDQWLYVRH
ncbi:hypothetical protein PVK06_034593 [Gossypium arboreum]|uniref:OTU domain-containing protein n=1 Tax=Gossypium arboreum TaxID=29729 RepID=A0ABR0NEQ4_GOSAR|nr:hypothetical protein PVK06_034593 [Gossypium arboreum]